MVKDVYAGKLNAEIEIFKNVSGTNAAGESLDAEESLKTRLANRIDGVGGEDEAGQMVATNVRTYVMRFDTEIAANATALFIRDFDGDWNIVNFQLVDSRKRYMKLKCLKRGENFTI